MEKILCTIGECSKLAARVDASQLNGVCEDHLKDPRVDIYEVRYLPKCIRDQLEVSPLHYCKGEIQPWDFILSQKLGYIEGNIVKYITRYKHKDGLKDLKKAKTYLEKLILIEEKKL